MIMPLRNCLKQWLFYNVDQTAFQKGKSTLIHIFTLRILIEIAKKMNLTLYIGSVDIEKAFDRVPRSLLGIGKCVLFALKQFYSFSIRVINFQGELSSSFRMERGCKTGGCFICFIVYHLYGWLISAFGRKV